MFDKFQMAVRDPIGVVAAITPWNFPMAIPTWKIMPALVCGNTVVFKPATDTPLVAAELVKVFEEAGLPEEAADAFRRATQAKPDFAEALANLGHALKAMGMETEARNCWSEAVKVMPELASTYF